MLHSTITAGSYILEKYSRSYPSNVSAQCRSQDLTAAQPEWQHFANPVISLTLDVKKSMDNKFESVRLRILWDIGMGHDGTPREITMEDLDLLSFSGLDSRFHSAQGPPLKAVYRGPVVGIRYQYPLTVPASSPCSYRRFQVNFASASDVAQFIDAIRPVCPCKENVGPPPPPIPISRPSVPRPASIQPPSAHVPPVRHHTNAPQWPPVSASATGMIERASQYRSSQEDLNQRALHFPPSSSSEMSLLPFSDPAPPIHPTSGFDKSSRPSSALPEMHSSQFTAYNASSLPASSQLTSSATMLAPPSQGPENRTREAFLESLREEPELYNLTRLELENLVSVIVREPGFPKLLEALDAMWVARGFLGR